MEIQLQDRPHLDAADARRRGLRDQGDRLVEVPGLDEGEPAQELLRPGEGTVRHEQLAVAVSHRRSRANTWKAGRKYVVSTPRDLLDPGRRLCHHGSPLPLRQGL